MDGCAAFTPDSQVRRAGNSIRTRRTRSPRTSSVCSPSVRRRRNSSALGVRHVSDTCLTPGYSNARMKLIRFGEAGRERPGVQRQDGTRVDASGFGADYDEMFFGGDGLQRLSKWCEREAARAPRVPPETRLGPPVRRPSKIICIGVNYRDHAADSGAEIPKEPIIFFKATSSIVGPDDPLVIPRNSRKVDWEVELAVVIGARAKYVTPEQAPRHVAGYMLHNDYSEREFQLERGGQWVNGKSADTFAPHGQFLATPDEF